MKQEKFSSTKEGKKLIDECPCSADEDCNCYNVIADRAYEQGYNKVHCENCGWPKNHKPHWRPEEIKAKKMVIEEMEYKLSVIKLPKFILNNEHNKGVALAVDTMSTFIESLRKKHIS